jgi:MFS family permease
VTEAAPSRATFRDVFAVREFRALWFSEILSVAGDRLALVALTLLVYDRTRSPLLAAIAYAAGYLPWVIGGLFLADIADRRPRRSVMISCDVVRAVLVAAMAVPGVPLGVLVALLFAATMFTPLDAAARSAITPDILAGERYALGVAVTQTTFYAAQIAGAVGGGVAVVFIGVRFSLALDAATFVLSALLIGLGIRARPAAARPEPGQQSPLARMRDGFRLVFADPALRTITLLAWLAVFYTIPEGVAAPYAARLGAGPVATGLVLASAVVGTTVFMPLFTRFVRPRQRNNLMGPLAVLTCGTLVLTVLRPGLIVSLVIFSVSAAFGVYQLAANTAFVAKVPNERRSQAFGIASMGLVVGQGLTFLVAGAAAEAIAPATVIAIGGGLGAVVAFVLTLRWRQVSPPGGRHAAKRQLHRAAMKSPAPPRRDRVVVLTRAARRQLPSWSRHPSTDGTFRTAAAAERASAAVFAGSLAKRECTSYIQVRMHLQISQACTALLL